MSELIGYTPEQHARISRAVRAFERPELGAAGVSDRQNVYRGPVRVIAMTDREYDSTTTTRVPVFVLDDQRYVLTVEQTGSALAGYLALILNGVRYLVECRRQTMAFPVAGLRVTVFPGLWEFDFGELAEGQTPTIEVEDITADENTTLCELFDDTDSVIFTGSTIVRREYWVSQQLDDSEDPLPVEYTSIRDVIPYQTGAVKAGAIGIGQWTWDAGFVVGGWQCRTFSHATGYVQDDDPVALEGVS